MKFISGCIMMFIFLKACTSVLDEPGIVMSPMNTMTVITAADLGITPAMIDAAQNQTIETEAVELGEALNYNEQQCLAKNIYFEARNEALDEQIAVAQVAINRANARGFPDTLCGVITQGPISTWFLENTGREVPLRNECQFSWFCDGKSDEPREAASWNYAQQLATEILLGQHEDITDGAKWYHADYIDTPYWTSGFVQTLRLNTHIYYRE
tara:strand:- start:5795 stop:6430 length:636 start_codon:yes stop_codon:yes gene_type:complete